MSEDNDNTPTFNTGRIPSGAPYSPDSPDSPGDFQIKTEAPPPVLANPTQIQPIPAEGEIVWDENNVLVHPAMAARAKAESEVALGLKTPEEVGLEPQDVPAFNSPQEAQASAGQTADPMTCPQPVRMQATK